MCATILGRKIGPVGFGLMGLNTQPRTEEVKFAAIKAALKAGCNYFDGGEFYGTPDNNSLTLLNSYFKKYPEDADKIVLNVKGGLKPDRAPLGTKEHISKSIENCLSMLGSVGRINQYEAARKDPNPDVSYEDDTLATIDSYVKAGKIDGISCSEINAQTLRSAAKKYKITSLEIELSLFTLDPLTNGLLEACGELGIPVLAYSPLGRGFLGGNIRSVDDLPEKDIRRMMPRYQPENFAKNMDLVHKIEAIAKKKGCTGGQIAINWILSLSKRPGMPIIIPIPGSSNPDRIKENATIIDLTEEDLAEVEKALSGFVTAGERYPKAFQAHLNL